MWRGTFPLVNL
jgi:hypothetical protein